MSAPKHTALHITLLILPIIFLFAGAGVYVALLATGFFMLMSGAKIPATVNIIKTPAVTAVILLFGFGLLSYTWSAAPDRTLDSASKLLALTGVFAFIMANTTKFLHSPLAGESNLQELCESADLVRGKNTANSLPSPNQAALCLPSSTLPQGESASLTQPKYQIIIIIAIMFIAPAIIVAKQYGYISIRHMDKGIAYYMLVLPVFCSYLLTDTNKKHIKTLYASLLITIIAVFMQTMDAAKIAVIITTAFVLTHSKGIKISGIKWLIPMLILSLPFAVQLLQGAEFAEKLIAELPESWQIRAAMWQQGYDVIMAHPWIGHGMDSSRTIMHANGAQVFQNHPHNIALQIWVELGLEGALLLAFTTYSAFKLAYRSVPIYSCMGLIYSVFAFVSFSAFAEWWVSSLYFAIITAKVFQDQKNEA